MEYVKLQLGCMMVVLYVSFIYIRERHAYKVKQREPVFEGLLLTAVLEIALDGITAWTVNHLEQVPAWLNMVLHLCFLCLVDIIVFMMFVYITDITRGLPKKRGTRLLLILPLLVNLVVVIVNIPWLEYRHGKFTNYSMGVSAYTCFVMVAVYMIAAFVVLFKYCHNLGHHKLVTITTYMSASVAVTVAQMLYPQILITSLVPALAIVGTYLNMENPVFTKLREYNNEMVMGFATLVENRDDSTGGHIRRTTEYVRMLARELRTRGFYKTQLTRDYIDNLVMAAPMHDVGKIAIPDAILQKPGKLTDEEYAIMKTHAERGGTIVRDTFAHMDDEAYKKIAYHVARHHHEKWNGRGYPDGLSEKDIPLCARIMAVADVFDAVSAKRCYRDALPLEECFRIIEKGRGQDFDPVIADVFLDMKEKIREVYEKESNKEKRKE